MFNSTSNQQPCYLCHVLQVKDSVNYDVHFLSDKFPHSRYKNVTSSECVYSMMDAKTFKLGPRKFGKVYRVRLRGIVVANGKCRAPSALARKAGASIDRWVNRCGGILLAKVHQSDHYNRMMIELFDPITKSSFTKVLLETYPTVYQPYRESPRCRKPVENGRMANPPKSNR